MYIYPNYETYHVTSLDDSGAGTLRDAVESANGRPRFILFDVGGYINLQTSIYLSKSYVYILGETAPTPVTVRASLDMSNKPTLIQIGKTNPFVGPHDIIIRHLRLRIGDDSDENGSSIFVWGGHDMVFDHLSCEWANDNLVTLWLAKDDPAIYNITIQRCIFAEPFVGHSTALAIHGDYNFTSEPINKTYENVYNVSVHHNLFANFSHRSPLTRSGGVEIVNNLIYNWDYKTWMPCADDISDFMNNYVRPGPLAENFPLYDPADQRIYQQTDDGCATPASLYVSGNIIESVKTDPDADDWPYCEHWLSASSSEALSDTNRRLTRMEQPAKPITVSAAADIVNDILNDCGAMPRDSLDTRIVYEVQTSTGSSAIKADVAAAGGWPA